MNNKNFFPSYWGLFAVLGIIVLCTLGAAGIQLALSLIAPTSLVNFVTYTATFGMAFFIMRSVRKNSNAPYHKMNYKKVKTLPLIISGFVALFISSAVDPLVSLIPISDFFIEAMKQMLTFDIWSFLTVAVAAAVLEELIFRGIVFDGLVRNYGPLAAILVSAFLFGLIHLNFTQGVGAGILGLYLGWVYWKTKSLIPVIFIHFVNNATSFFLMSSGDFEITDNFWTYFNQGDYTFLYISIASVPLSIIGLLYLNKSFNKHPVSFENEFPIVEEQED
jgi:membrane protease YdiL (CAAX protease family)